MSNFFYNALRVFTYYYSSMGYSLSELHNNSITVLNKNFTWNNNGVSSYDLSSVMAVIIPKKLLYTAAVNGFVNEFVSHPEDIKNLLFHETQHLINKLDNQSDTTVPGIVVHLGIYLSQIRHSSFISCSSGNKARIKWNVNRLLNLLVNNPKIRFEWQKEFEKTGII